MVARACRAPPFAGGVLDVQAHTSVEAPQKRHQRNQECRDERVAQGDLLPDQRRHDLDLRVGAFVVRLYRGRADAGKYRTAEEKHLSVTRHERERRRSGFLTAFLAQARWSTSTYGSSSSATSKQDRKIRRGWPTL